MRVAVKPFAARDLLDMALPAGHPAAGVMLRGNLARGYAEAGNAFTAFVPDADGAPGRVLLCGGAVQVHPGYASLWAFYAADIGVRSWGHLLRQSRDFIAGLPHGRVDAAVAANDAGAVRWAVGCGLACETALADAAPDGGAMLIFRRSA